MAGSIGQAPILVGWAHVLPEVIVHLLPLFSAQEKGVLAGHSPHTMYEISQLPLQGNYSTSALDAGAASCYLSTLCQAALSQDPADLPPPITTSLNLAGSEQSGPEPWLC